MIKKCTLILPSCLLLLTACNSSLKPNDHTKHLAPTAYKHAIKTKNGYISGMDTMQPSTQNNVPTENPPATNQGQNGTTEATNASQIQQVVDLTNAERRKNGLKELTLDRQLTQMAQAKANDMDRNNYFSHNSPTKGSPFNQMKNSGVDYNQAAENIATGQNTPSDAVNDWMNSEGHRKNILNPDYTHIGVGHTTTDEMWVQEFIKK
ncbi:Cysteine-rich secretory protein family [Fictibacillus macauensis ZFHKF-1]|uniref:Cysteine-rich secretory protein family n=1 Tax=Fictibacillus macauensis ZFHKF-1 TaxID=1196324 RepID=I8J4N4_9BACL|nr:CAP domain-containing protein [Fictibacillus macauensis]EIT86741.1 Cysteine-rich secretory protein family [Fictibacillus macauensis ZFHKF-1]